MAAWQLHRAGQKVLLVDKSAHPATGGSGAAGAFVSPKIGKGGALQRLTNEAFAYAHRFYKSYFPDYFHQTGIVRLPKDDVDAQTFALYAPHNDARFELLTPSRLHAKGIKSAYDAFFFPDAGVCDAPELCRAVANEVSFMQCDVEAIGRQKDRWVLTSSTRNPLRATSLVFALGYQNTLVDMRYMGVKGLWGSRGDYYSALPLEVSMHQKISVSANIGGIVKLGATHVKAPNPCEICDGRPLASLEAQAARMVETHDFRLKETFCGMRAGSRDYTPVVGEVVDVAFMDAHHPEIYRGATPPLRHLPNLYVLNGMGGRGFVFAPLMAKWLSERIVSGKPVDARVHPDRLFFKWARRIKR